MTLPYNIVLNIALGSTHVDAALLNQIDQLVIPLGVGRFDAFMTTITGTTPKSLKLPSRHNKYLYHQHLPEPAIDGSLSSELESLMRFAYSLEYNCTSMVQRQLNGANYTRCITLDLSSTPLDTDSINQLVQDMPKTLETDFVYARQSSNWSHWDLILSDVPTICKMAKITKIHTLLIPEDVENLKNIFEVPVDPNLMLWNYWGRFLNIKFRELHDHI